MIGNTSQEVGKAIMAPFKAAFNATLGSEHGRPPVAHYPGLGSWDWRRGSLCRRLLTRGGIVDKATLAVIGEGGENEAVIPLSKLQPMIDKGVNAALAETGGGGTVYNVMTLDARQLKNLDLLIVYSSVAGQGPHKNGGDIDGYPMGETVCRIQSRLGIDIGQSDGRHAGQGCDLCSNHRAVLDAPTMRVTGAHQFENKKLP